MKKILFSIPELRGGGAEKVLIDILKNLDKEKYEITLLLFYRKAVYLDEVPKNIKIISISDKLGYKFSKLWTKIFCKVPDFFYKMMIKEDYDVEIAFMEGLSTKFIAHSSNKKSEKIAWVHTDLKDNHWTKWFFKNLEEENNCYSKFNKLIFVSEDSKKAFENEFKNNEVLKETIYNPVIGYEIEEKAKEIEITYEGFTIISSGRLSKPKGFDRLIKAHGELVKKYPHQLIIIGEGSERENLELLIKELDLSDSVKLKGFIKNPYPYIKAADLFICSSRAEGYSLVVAEAVIMEKAIISTAVTGPKEILKDGEFGMICGNSTEGIKNSMEKFLADKSLVKFYEDKSSKGKKNLDYRKLINEIEKLLDK